MESTSPSSVTVKLTRYAWLSIAAAVTTFLLKLGAWKLTGSIGLLSDALESLANLAAAFIALASLSVAAQPPDDEHSYGHTKVEYFAGGTEGALILFAAAGIGWGAMGRLFSPKPLEQVGVGLAVSVFASGINLVVARVLHRVGKRHHSVALTADAKHLMTDVWTSVAVVTAVLLIYFTGWERLDAIIGLILAFHIVFVGAKLIRESMLGLMDTGFPPEELDTIHQILAKFAPEGVQYHALRTRRAGARRFMAVHLLVPGACTVQTAHETAEKIEAELRSAIPRLTVLTHLEPAEDPVSWQDQGLDRG